MHFWLDTSAVAKQYVRENGSAAVGSLLAQPDAVVHISQLVRTELASAMARRVRSGELTTDHALSGMSAFFAHTRRGYHVTAVDGSVQGEAERIIFAHPLRAADALHVAGALAVDRHLGSDGESIEFVTADRRQAAAARAEGLDVRLVG